MEKTTAYGMTKRGKLVTVTTMTDKFSLRQREQRRRYYEALRK